MPQMVKGNKPPVRRGGEVEIADESAPGDNEELCHEGMRGKEK
jgi:hypothetical protein